MHVSRMNWMQMEQQAQRDDRAVLPIGSTEQHAYLSLSVDAILAEKVSVDGEPVAAPTAPPPRPGELLSRELDRFGRDPVYEAAARAAAGEHVRHAA